VTRATAVVGSVAVAAFVGGALVMASTHHDRAQGAP
jgi:hypothetical protein